MEIMWNKVATIVAGYPERLKVVKTLLENGLAVRGSRIYLNQIELPVMKVARAAGVDRRTVGETVRIIEAKDRKSTRLNSSHHTISYAVFCLKKKKITNEVQETVKEERHITPNYNR